MTYHTDYLAISAIHKPEITEEGNIQLWMSPGHFGETGCGISVTSTSLQLLYRALPRWITCLASIESGELVIRLKYFGVCVLRISPLQIQRI